MAITNTVLRQRVQRGAQRLDERFGKDWRNTVDPITLCLDDGGLCVVGQATGRRYGCGGMRELGLSILDGVHYGFDLPVPCASETQERLLGLWLEKLGG